MKENIQISQSKEYVQTLNFEQTLRNPQISLNCKKQNISQSIKRSNNLNQRPNPEQQLQTEQFNYNSVNTNQKNIYTKFKFQNSSISKSQKSQTPVRKSKNQTFQEEQKQLQKKNILQNKKQNKIIVKDIAQTGTADSQIKYSQYEPTQNIKGNKLNQTIKRDSTQKKLATQILLPMELSDQVKLIKQNYAMYEQIQNQNASIKIKPFCKFNNKSQKIEYMNSYQKNQSQKIQNECVATQRSQNSSLQFSRSLVKDKIKQLQQNQSQQNLHFVSQTSFSRSNSTLIQNNNNKIKNQSISPHSNNSAISYKSITSKFSQITSFNNKPISIKIQDQDQKHIDRKIKENEKYMIDETRPTGAWVSAQKNTQNQEEQSLVKQKVKSLQTSETVSLKEHEQKSPIKIDSSYQITMKKQLQQKQYSFAIPNNEEETSKKNNQKFKSPKKNEIQFSKFDLPLKLKNETNFEEEKTSNETSPCSENIEKDDINIQLQENLKNNERNIQRQAQYKKLQQKKQASISLQMSDCISNLTSQQCVNQSQKQSNQISFQSFDQIQINEVQKSKRSFTSSSLHKKTSSSQQINKYINQQILQKAKYQIFQQSLRYLNQKLGAVIIGYKSRRIYFNNDQIRQYRIQFRDLIQFAFMLQTEISEIQDKINNIEQKDVYSQLQQEMEITQKTLQLTLIEMKLKKKQFKEKFFSIFQSNSSWLKESQPRNIQDILYEEASKFEQTKLTYRTRKSQKLQKISNESSKKQLQISKKCNQISKDLTKELKSPEQNISTKKLQSKYKSKIQSILSSEAEKIRELKIQPQKKTQKIEQNNEKINKIFAQNNNSTNRYCLILQQFQNQSSDKKFKNTYVSPKNRNRQLSMSSSILKLQARNEEQLQIFDQQFDSPVDEDQNIKSAFVLQKISLISPPNMQNQKKIKKSKTAKKNHPKSLQIFQSYFQKFISSTQRKANNQKRANSYFFNFKDDKSEKKFSHMNSDIHEFIQKKESKQNLVKSSKQKQNIKSITNSQIRPPIYKDLAISLKQESKNKNLKINSHQRRTRQIRSSKGSKQDSLQNSLNRTIQNDSIQSNQLLQEGYEENTHFNRTIDVCQKQRGDEGIKDEKNTMDTLYKIQVMLDSLNQQQNKQSIKEKQDLKKIMKNLQQQFECLINQSN